MAKLVVQTPSGSVAGVPRMVSVFRGIPFAAPPIGELRWRPPSPPTKWRDVRQADQFGPDPVQTPLPMMPRRDNRMSEDCLTLNIWTPTPHHGAKLPVMVW